MKQNLLKLMLVLCAFLVGGSMWADEKTSTLNFTAACGGSGTANDGAEWTVTSDGAESNFDSTCGIHYGTNKASVTYLQLSTSDISGTITKVVVNTRDAQAKATVSVTVGGSAFTSSSSTTATNTSADYTFTGTASGEIVVRVDRGSSMTKAIYVKSIVVTYEEEGGDPSKTATVTTFNGESSYDVELGQSFTAPTATVDNGGTVTYSSSKPEVATVDATTGAVTLVAAGKTTITASYAGDDTYAASSASYSLTVTKPVPVYASLEELAADENLSDGDIVNVTFENVEIKSVYVSSGNKRTGIYFDIQKGGYDIEIYYSSAEVPSEWVAGGTVSGTMQCPWTKFNNTWELKPNSGTWSWDNLTYQAPAGAKTTATIEFTAKSKLEVGSADEFDVTYNGDGVLEVNSTNEDVATVAIEAGHVVVTAIAAGTTVITVSAPETDEYTEASKQYTLTVSPAKQAFDRNVHKALVAEKDGRYYAAYNTISGSNTYFTVKEVTVYNNKVYFQNDEDASDIAWNITIDDTDATKATVQNLYGDYLVLGTKTAVSLSSNENELYANENGGFYYSETGRGFGYNSSANPIRMAGYNISTTYPVAKAMSFAGDEDAPMRITSAGWATFYAPFPVAIPEGVTAYTGTMMDDWIQLNELTEGCIPAATGVVVAKAVEGDAFVASLTPVDFVPSVPVVSCYIGNTSNANMEVEIGDYLLQKQNDVVGWYKVEGEGFTLAPYRCYLAKGSVPEPNQSRSFFGFAPDDATGINSIATEAKTKADGKYIVKGQIVVVKAGKAYNMNGTEVK